MSNKRRKKTKNKKRKARPKARPRTPAAKAPQSVQPSGPRLTDPAGPSLELDSDGYPVPSPFAELGLEESAGLAAEEIRAAFRARLAEFKVEAEPERLRRLRDARDHLLATTDRLRAMLQTFPRLNPTDYGLPPAPQAGSTPADENHLTAHHRLVTGLTLYALLEQDFESEAGHQGSLFD